MDLKQFSRAELRTILTYLEMDLRERITNAKETFAIIEVKEEIARRFERHDKVRFIKNTHYYDDDENCGLALAGAQAIVEGASFELAWVIFPGEKFCEAPGFLNGSTVPVENIELIEPS